ncbi:D-beta-hydroxybutyrate dehydrogenase, mitochondrial [Leptinotarsa decemlineata]|uniref:D-beta-hydroxybutyrate dehydrogenase, mitochondrial n=1 Tax=Leptinotarsa decemlineata TaxID=7539 RepID=UPI003D307D29
MSGPFKRRPSLKSLPAFSIPPDAIRKASIRRASAVGLGVKPSPATHQEVPWDMLDRCTLPILFCHATAVILSNALNVLHISEVTTFTLFIWFTIVTIGAVLFYHNLKVTAAGKAVLITGCDSRIGSALARQLDEQGFTVFAGFQNASGNAAAEELKEECSARLHVLQLDVASENQILAASLYAVEHLPDGAPGLWAVVHAQSWVALGEIEWIPPQVIKKAADINFIGPTRVTQIMLPLVRRAKGRIIVVTSGLCRVASPVRGIHCGLLAALEAQAECLRKELRSRGVDVVVVAPGELTSGSSWLSDETILEQAKDMWKQLCQEQRQEYGEDYFEKAIRSLEKYTKTQESDTSPVLRALNDAVVRTFPLKKYTPVSRKEKIQAFIADHFPRSVYDIIYS